MPATLSTVDNYDGMLYTRVDEATRFVDAIYSRGKGNGRTVTQSLEFVLSSGYSMEAPEQPEISEVDSMTAPSPETTERDQEYNVVQIFQRSVDVSYVKQSNRDMLAGVHNAGQSNNVPNELDFQIGRRIAQMKLDLNYTLINGVYQYVKGSETDALKTRGILEAIVTNLFDNEGDPLTPGVISDAIMNAIANGLDPTALEIWCNPAMLDNITACYAALPGSTLPATRTEGGMAYVQIMTPYAMLNVNWEPKIPNKKLLFVNMSQMAVAEKPYYDENGQLKGVLFYEPLAKVGASERGQIYGELGCDYGAEWHHILIDNLA